MLFTKILVAVDGSKHSESAAQYAKGIARTQKAEIVLFNCPGHIPTIVGGTHREDLKKSLLEEGNALLEKFRIIMNESDVPFTEVVKTGNTADVLAGVADDMGVDLIVMGSRGLSDLEGMLMGSVTHSVMQRTSCPVLLIR